MKIKLSLVTAAVSLAFGAVPTIASADNATVGQYGSHHKAVIGQYYNGNASASISQDGSSHDSYIMQKNNSGSISASITASKHDNEGVV